VQTSGAAESQKEQDDYGYRAYGQLSGGDGSNSLAVWHHQLALAKP